MCASEADRLPQAGIVCSYRLGGCRYIAKVSGTFDLSDGGVHRVG